MNILVFGLGYVGTANAILLAQKNKVTCYDLDKKKIDQINKKVSPVEDKEANDFLSNKSLELSAVSELPNNLEEFDYAIIATPTNYDVSNNSFDISSIETCIDLLQKKNCPAVIIIRSTLPIGYIEILNKKYDGQEIIFVPEFLREGKALHDSLYPSRIIVGSHSEKAKTFANLLIEGSLEKNTKVLFTKPTEAESSKLFANAFLAQRVSFFNELDSFAFSRGLDTKEIIEAISLDPRIGDYYNNPSFGYGGYCLPKDTKQLLKNFEGIPQRIIEAIVESNSIRKDFIASEILKIQPKNIGIFRLAMKEGSDNIRESSMLGIIERIKEKDISIIIYEPLIKEKTFFDSPVYEDLDKFKKDSSLIICNRNSQELKDVQDKVFTRDIFQQD